MARGGARPGAGRKPKAKLYAGPVREAEAKILDKLPWLVGQLLTLADGVWVEEATREGARLVYQRPPDRQAAEYLLDRIMGKPTQPLDIREQAVEIAAELGCTVDEVLAEAAAISANGRH